MSRDVSPVEPLTGLGMALPAPRLMTFAAVAFTAVAQVVVAPASCCLLRSSLADDGACCHRPAAPASQSCCRRHAPEAETDAAAAGRGFPQPGECLWCSSGPKISPQDRVPPPTSDVASLPAAVAGASPSAAPISSRLGLLVEPFHRTAMATCAWLCVWRK